MQIHIFHHIYGVVIHYFLRYYLWPFSSFSSFWDSHNAHGDRFLQLCSLFFILLYLNLLISVVLHLSSPLSVQVYILNPLVTFLFKILYFLDPKFYLVSFYIIDLFIDIP